MIKNKQLIIEKSASAKKEKKKFNKNSSFNGIESKKSPKTRRKSIATVLLTPLKKKKQEKLLNDWTVTENDTEDTDLIDEHPEEKTLKTPKFKNKQSNSAFSASEKKPIQKCSNLAKPNKQKIIKAENGSSSNNKIEQEQKFGIEANNIAKAVETVIKLHRENPKLQNQLFDDPIQIFLQVCCHKVPRGPSRIIRIPLPNPLLTPDSEVCLIVPELKGVKNIEHEKHVDHYENLLRTKGVENIKKIMTFHEFRTEHETFEQMSRLVDLYDAFLVDGRISGKVVKKCGKIFYKKRKVPTSVKLQATKLKEHIDKALSKAFFLLHLKGDSYSIQFGHNKLQTQDLVDNVFSVIEHLNKEFPGGFQNIKGLHISTTRATSVPIYSSFKIPKEVVIPKLKPKKPKAYKTYKGELTTLPNAEVIVKPTGQVIVKRTKMEENMDKGSNVKIGKKKSESSKKTRKRKHTETVSVKADDNADGNSEANSSENVVKKKIKKADSDKNVGERKRQQANHSQDKKKTKVVVGIKKKQKKNKVKNQR